MIQNDVNNDILISFYKSKCLSLITNKQIFDKHFLSDLTFADPLTPLGLNSRGLLEETFKELFNNNINIDFSNNIDTIFYPYIKKYLTLKEYINCRKYSKEEIKKFFKLFGDEITDKDFININNFDYLFEHIYLIPIKKFIFSKEYIDLVLTIAGLT